MKNSYKTIKIILSVAILISITLTFTQIVQAQQKIYFTPQVSIGDEVRVGEEIEVSGTTFANYIIAIYNWSMRAIVLLAIIMIMVAGSRWMWAGGNAASITQARNQIVSALIGLVLAISSYTILSFINPSLVRFQSLEIQPIVREALDDERVAANSCFNDSFSSQFLYNQVKCYKHDEACQEVHIPLPESFPTGLRYKDIEFIRVALGADDDGGATCPTNINYSDVTLSQADNFWIGVVADDSPGTSIYAFDCTVDNGGAATKIKACFSGDTNCRVGNYHPSGEDTLIGFELKTMDASAGDGAFFYSHFYVKTSIECVKTCTMSIPDDGICIEAGTSAMYNEYANSQVPGWTCQKNLCLGTSNTTICCKQE